MSLHWFSISLYHPQNSLLLSLHISGSSTQLSSSSAVWPWPDNHPPSGGTPSAAGSVWPRGRCWGRCIGPRPGNTSWSGCSSTAPWGRHNGATDPPVARHQLTYDLCRIWTKGEKTHAHDMVQIWNTWIDLIKIYYESSTQIGISDACLLFLTTSIHVFLLIQWYSINDCLFHAVMI